jgi:glycosyltransferase involved in cell wall biosynthesis
MSGPTFSVCVITYNQQQYLTQCLEGILAQRGDYTMEVILADDCSTDGTQVVADAFARRDPRIRLLKADRNLGMGGNLRSAFAACAGEFIALCDGDDFWTDPDKLSLQLAAFADPSVTVSMTGGIRVDEAGRELGRFASFSKAGPLTAADILAGGGGQWPTCSTVFRRSCLARLPEETYDQPVIDWPLDVLVAAQGRAWYDPRPTCAWRMASRGSWTENLRNADEFADHHRRHRDLEDFFRRHLGTTYEQAVRRGFARHVLYFYAASRSPQRTKWRELAADLPRLDCTQRAVAIAFTMVPGLGELALALRRRTVRNSTR